MTLFDNYLSSSDMSLQKSACCPVRCCSISCKCSRKLWHTVFIVSISWTVHWEQGERAKKGVLSDSPQEFTMVEPAFPLGLPCLQWSPVANVWGRVEGKPCLWLLQVRGGNTCWDGRAAAGCWLALGDIMSEELGDVGVQGRRVRRAGGSGSEWGLVLR